MVLLGALIVSLAMAPVVPQPVREGCTPLQTAVALRDFRTVRHLASRSLLGFSGPLVDVDEASRAAGPCFGRTALMIAAENADDEMVSLLLSSRADAKPSAVLEGFGDHAFTARCLALSLGNGALARTLEEATGPLRADDGCVEDARLFAAIARGKKDQVELQLRGLPDPEVLLAALERLTGGYKGTSRMALVDPLLDHALLRGVPMARVFAAAIEANDDQMVSRLCAKVKLTGSVELARAVELSRFEMIAPLIQAGARTDLKPMANAVHQAIRTHDNTTLFALLSAGWHGDDETPVLLWSMQERPSLFWAFLEGGFSVEADDEIGTTPLMYAAAHDEPATMQKLMARGASPLTADVGCRTARSIREEAGLQPAKSLLAAGAPVPGRAAQRLHVGCGPAHFRIEFADDVEVYFDGAFATLEPNAVYQTEPGLHTLRIARKSERAVRRETLQLVPGMNVFQASPDDDDAL